MSSSSDFLHPIDADAAGPGATLPDPALLAQRHTEALAARGAIRSYRRGMLLIQEGDVGSTLYIVRSGRLRAYAADPKGREITLGLYGAGEYVGEMSLDGGPRSANVETLEPTTCAVVTREDLLAYIAQEPSFALEMMARLIRRARLATESTRSLALIDVYGRAKRLLEQLAGPPAADGSRTLGERITHQQIACLLACSREMVSKLMKDLEVGGYVGKREQRIVLLKGLPAGW
ncbi:MAG: crp-like helix-turn-helix domain protein [Ramlibacter sp.]|uniref:Crp/Fnr family transcriptional regulator n=1 Tax=Ramlibacter sp. TaxID=1917967 RepID=UPI002623BC4B|nr:Crp/Fnr family transcriptional regulator [Ramlibacter sp.]MDB5751002.1 crp-like helix-turn-helix domain protein [Ramlibacter sp.]